MVRTPSPKVLAWVGLAAGLAAILAVYLAIAEARSWFPWEPQASATATTTSPSTPPGDSATSSSSAAFTSGTPAPSPTTPSTPTPTALSTPTQLPRTIGPDDVVESSPEFGFVGYPPFQINNRQYLDGIGLHLVDGMAFPGDSHDIAVPAGYTQLVVTIGLDDGSSSGAEFHVRLSHPATEQVLWEGDVAVEQAHSVTVDVAGMTRVRLFGTGLNRPYANEDGEVVLTGEFRA